MRKSKKQTGCHFDLTVEEARKQFPELFGFGDEKKKSKAGNQRVEVDGIKFQSKREARRYGALKLLEGQGLIRDLRLQVSFRLSIGDQKLCHYRADFVYEDVASGQQIVEDCKGWKSQLYRLKKRMMKVILGIEIKET